MSPCTVSSIPRGDMLLTAVCSPEVHPLYPPGVLYAKAWGWSGCLSRSTSSRPHLPWSSGCCTSLQLQPVQRRLLNSSLYRKKGLAKVSKHSSDMSQKCPVCIHNHNLQQRGLSRGLSCQLCSIWHQQVQLAPVIRAMLVHSTWNNAHGRHVQGQMHSHCCIDSSLPCGLYFGHRIYNSWFLIVYNDRCRCACY